MNLNDFFSNPESFASQLIRKKARNLVRHAGFRKSEREDIEQELKTEVIKKFNCFDPGRSRETTFIALVVEKKAISLVRTRVAQKRDFRREAQSLNDSVRDADGGGVERAQTLDATSARAHTSKSACSDEERAQLRFDMAEVLKVVPDDLRPLAELLMQMSEFAASRVLGMSRRQVANDVARLRELFENADLRGYL